MIQLDDARRARLAELLEQSVDQLGPEFIDLASPPIAMKLAPHEVYDLEDKDLVRAAMVAILLGQPLLLTGEPGVGKTQFAEAFAERLGRPIQQSFHVKSTTTGRDMLYVFDEVARFRAGAEAPLRDFIRFTALGRAILWSMGPAAPARLGSVRLETILGSHRATALPLSGTTLTLGALFPEVFEVETARGVETLRQATQSFVLIDELDKAPRDTPNDLLHEIDRMSFLVDEIDLRVAADAAHWPIVVITSNSERSLPDAFLRRCVFHWIGFPSEERLRRIVARHCSLAESEPHDPDAAFFRGAVRIFEEMRARAVNKRPATAELIGFVLVLRAAGLPLDRAPSEDDGRVRAAIAALMKTRVDREAAGADP